MSKPSRRAVMQVFGEYLDYIAWFNSIKRGEDELPQGMIMAIGARRSLSQNTHASARNRLLRGIGVRGTHRRRTGD